jgi:hypothetical protein
MYTEIVFLKLLGDKIWYASVFSKLFDIIILIFHTHTNYLAQIKYL